MTTKDDGGPAFPVLEKFESYDDEAGRYRDVYQPCGGMSLRDYFAAKALGGLLARSDSAVPHCAHCRPVGEDAGEHYADIAYRYADAMLKERSK